MKKYEKVFKVIYRDKTNKALSCVTSQWWMQDLNRFYNRKVLNYSTKKFTEKPIEEVTSLSNLGIFCFKTLEQAKTFVYHTFIEADSGIEIFLALAENPREVANYTDKFFPKGTMLTEKLKLVKRYL